MAFQILRDHCPQRFLPRRLIALANKEVPKVMNQSTESILLGKYSSQHGVAAAERHFFRKLGSKINDKN